MDQLSVFRFNNTQFSYRTGGEGSEVMLLFHGFGQDGSVFNPFIENARARYTFYSIDLYFHGESVWPSEAPLEKDGWEQTLSAFLEHHGITRFSVTGYSIGAKIALTTTEAFPERILQLILIAPDGVKNNFWYALATRMSLARKLFKSTIRSPLWFIRIAQTLSAIGIVHPGVVRFALRQMETEEKRTQVYYTWVVFRKLRVGMQTLGKQINEHHIRVTILVGKHDKIIPPGDMKRLLDIVPEGRLQIMDAGHSSLLKESLLWLVNN